MIWICRNGALCEDKCEGCENRVAFDIVRRSKWEHLESGWHDLWRCASCGDEWTFEYDPTDKETMVNYCPNCGADMRERRTDEV